uniref:NADH-ubiquinone oxidoreductase chain 5 n=1 Tax=Pediculus schaeffi TaxID=240286 RepID=M4VNR5_PEDSC|nr:NADH dehydrogenase subunit 5 [Pediculus schaeffi]
MPYSLLIFSVVTQLCFIFLYPSSGVSIYLPLTFLPITEMDLYFIFDKLSFTFMVMVFTVSMLVMMYSNTYMYDHILKSNFIISMVLFIISMIFLSLSGTLFWSFIGWDGLGLMSFILILFNKSWNSQKSGVITFLMNRLGDSFIISCSAYVSMWGFYESKWPWLFSIFLILGGISKSAQFPFSSWLPEAMAAPTPVSSLVHSSTLVTAGIYLLARFGESIEDFNILYFLSFLSIILSGVSALWSSDLKKVVAYSTLSHISLMLFYLAEGSIEGALVHMLMHSVFKSLLFMTLGMSIFTLSSWQDSRYLFIYSSTYSMASLVSVYSCLSMAGLPFLSGGYSKEILLVLSLKKSVMSFIVFNTAVILTSGYSYRILKILMSNVKIPYIFMSKDLFKTPLKLSQMLNILSSAWISSSPLYLLKLSQTSILLSGKLFLAFSIGLGILLGSSWMMSISLFSMKNEIFLSFASLPAFVYISEKTIPSFFKIHKFGADGKWDSALSWISQSSTYSISKMSWMLSMFTITFPAVIIILFINWLLFI